MTETQLASMRIGSVDVIDERQRESKTPAMIHIFQDNQMVGWLTKEDVLDDLHVKSLENTLETYDIQVHGHNKYVEYLSDRNRITIPDEDGNLIEFIIAETKKIKGRSHTVRVLAKASYLQDIKKAKVIRPTTLNEYTVSMLTGWALDESDWQVGIIESDNYRTMTIENPTNPYEFLKRIANEFDLELRFRVEHDGNRITGRFVDLLERVGSWQGREVEFGHDLNSIERSEKTENVVTCLVGYGPEDEDGNRLEVIVKDEEAIQRWGELWDYYEPQSSRLDMTESELRQYTRTELKKRINKVVTYKADIIDLENVPGMENKKIRFGDTIHIKDLKFNPSLYLEARVFEQRRSLFKRSRKQVKLGDFTEFTQEEVDAIWKVLQKRINMKIDAAELREYAEPKKVESSTPPEIKQGENPIWVKTDGDIKTPHVVIGNEWVKMTPTTADEVNAYNKKETDDITRDASRIETGILDVNQVPLRTSKTGARIEWDGVNGFVQYDQDGNPVNWFDLEGNLYATNGHFSGDVTGATGTFGDVKVNEGDFTLTDSISTTEYSIVANRNLIMDHSFEMVKTTLTPPTSSEINYSWKRMRMSDFRWENHWEIVEGGPNVAVTYGPDDSSAMPIFGDQAIVVRNGSSVGQSVYDGISAGTTYALSAHFKRQKNVVAGGRPRMRVLRIGATGNVVSVLADKSFDPVPDDYRYVRESLTFTVPSNLEIDESIYVIMTGANNEWVQCDGVQLVQDSIPSNYYPEDSTWKMSKGHYPIVNRQAALWSGAVYLMSVHEIYPDKRLDECNTGWVLEWSLYVVGEGPKNNDYQYTYIPKSATNGSFRDSFWRAGSNYNFWVHKYFYLNNEKVWGHDSNGNGDNRNYALRAIYEF